MFVSAMNILRVVSMSGGKDSTAMALLAIELHGARRIFLA
jgi:3'-phosphoadenosine 5'-phosphosulfate sulfotransferase (PAPS reductase)/FAD synthetase